MSTDAMSLSTDQQKTIRSLIDNSTSFNYLEVRDELYDHFASGISSYQEQGFSFTDSLNCVYNDLGGEDGICRIEAGYIKMTKNLGKSLYRKFVWQYFKSFRWLAAILAAVLTSFILPQHLALSPGTLCVLFHASVLFHGLRFFRTWRLTGEQAAFYNEHRNIRAVTSYNYYIAPMSVAPLVTILSVHSDGIVLFVSSGILFIILDYSISLLKYMKNHWLLPEVTLV